MTKTDSGPEFLALLRRLIDAWCDRRCLKALSRILPAYLSFNGFTDGWGALREALRNVRAFARDELTDQEVEGVANLIAAADRIIDRDLNAS